MPYSTPRPTFFPVIPTLVSLALTAVAAAATPQSSALALADWRIAHGSNWQVVDDDGTGRVRFLYGGRTQQVQRFQTGEELEPIARAAIAEARPLFGVDPATLVADQAIFLPLSHAGSSDKWSLRFVQYLSGRPVVDAAVHVLFDAQGRVLSIDSTALADVDSFDASDRLGAAGARRRAAGEFEREVRLRPDSIGAAESVVVQRPIVGGREARLAWRVDVQAGGGEEHARGLAYFLDARDGAVLERRELVHHFDVSGTVHALVTPGTQPDLPTNPPQSKPLPHVRVNSAQGSAVSDANGNFTIVGASAPLQVDVGFEGPFHDLQEQQGAPFTLTQTLNSATGNVLVLNPTPTAIFNAEANSMNWIGLLRDWTRAINPADATADFLALSKTNIVATCNAYYDGTSVNFFLAGGGCPNTSYSTVVLHEMGHWLNVRYSSGNGPDGFGEGNADSFAMYVADSPNVGEGFFGSGTLRSGWNTRQFCGDSSGGCYGGPHADGEVLMGALWKVRANLQAALGSSAGSLTADTLFNAWMNAYNDSQIKSIIETHWLTLDDDDGNIDNGTPHRTPIDQGFRAQGFPGHALADLYVTNVTRLADSDVAQPSYTVFADVFAQTAPPLTAVTLHVRTGVGAFAPIPMTLQSGVTYGATIPGPACGSVVEYYVTAADSGAHSTIYPALAPNTPYAFRVGLESVRFVDSFQTTQGWSEDHSQATAGTWERGDPIDNPNSPYDPPGDSDGTQSAFVTKNNWSNPDVDGGSQYLFSPNLDLRVGQNLLRYDWFLARTDPTTADRLELQISSQGGAGPWTTVVSHVAGSGGGWQTQTVTQAQLDLLGIARTATTTLRFVASDVGADHVLEAGVDRVRHSLVTCTPCAPAPSLYCSSKVNSLGCVPLIAVNGVPSATAQNGFTIECSDVRNEKNGLLLYSLNGPASLPFQGGTLCLTGPIRRTVGFSSGGNSAPVNDCSGVWRIDWNSFARGALGGNPSSALSTPATVVHCQFWGRDPGFPAPNNSALSQGLTFTTCE